jgi:DNA-binding NtrC family response regulator
MKKIDITTPYKGLSKFYFEKIIDTIIIDGNLSKKNLNILDYGCGLKFLEKRLNKKIFNYDIDKNLTEIFKWNTRAYDIVVLNHVIMYMSENEFFNLLKKIKNKNNKCKIIIGLGRESVLNKFLAYSMLRFDHLKNTKMNYKKQIKLIFKNLNIIQKKRIYFLTEIYFCKF